MTHHYELKHICFSSTMIGWVKRAAGNSPATFSLGNIRGDERPSDAARFHFVLRWLLHFSSCLCLCEPSFFPFFCPRPEPRLHFDTRKPCLALVSTVIYLCRRSFARDFQMSRASSPVGQSFLIFVVLHESPCITHPACREFSRDGGS